MKWFKYFFLTLFHPIDTFYLIKKDRKELSKLAVFLVLFAAVAMKIIYVYTVNFTLSVTTAAEANALVEIGIILLPILLWAVASYAVMTVCGGESTFGETFTISVYSLAPYIVCTPITIGLSHIFSTSEQAFFTGIQAAIIAWVVILLFVGFMQSNGLKFSHALGFSLLSVLAMVVIAVTFLLAFGLGAQIVKFVQELVAEIKFLLR
ncbi:MAG: DUF1282 domain-containing protein [Ruminococcaceae bacterium]|nr:DUF1282 domain-containing protein [Oscillospiraceae bacterium]